MAVTTLEAAILSVQAMITTVSGVRAAPGYPPDSMNLFPFVVAWPGEGTWEFGPGYGVKRGLHTIKLELHVQRSDLPRDVQKVYDFVDRVPNKLMSDPTLGGTVDTFGRIRTDGMVPMAWNGVDTIGIRWFVEEVKLVTVIS